jgi:hypothetical protein
MNKKVNLAWLCFLLAFWLGVTGSSRGEKEKKDASPNSASYALLEVSCFNSQGFSLSGVSAEVRVKIKPGEKPSKQSWRAVSSPRGEFALRLPPGPATYVVRLKREGFLPQEKEVAFTLDERQDLYFNLEPIHPGH